MLIGGATAALTMGGGDSAKSPAATADDVNAAASRDALRADRDHARDASASPSPATSDPAPQPTSPAPTSPAPAASQHLGQVSPSASPSPTVTKAASPTSTTVTSSGTCKASFYTTGSTTANGEAYNPDGVTAASKTLAFNTQVRVTNQANDKSVVVRINDRGPYVEGRCLDLSRGAFVQIASTGAGVISIQYEVLG